jgi:hypothetical protein
MPSHVFPTSHVRCHMPPYSHADIPSKFPHRNPGGPANVWVAWSVTNLSRLDLAGTRTRFTHRIRIRPRVDSSVKEFCIEPFKSTGGSYSL